MRNKSPSGMLESLRSAAPRNLLIARQSTMWSTCFHNCPCNDKMVCRAQARLHSAGKQLRSGVPVWPKWDRWKDVYNTEYLFGVSLSFCCASRPCRIISCVVRTWAGGESFAQSPTGVLQCRQPYLAVVEVRPRSSILWTRSAT